MKQVWKRNVVAATVLLFVCAAVYLNWKYASNVADEAGTESGKVLGQSTLVSGEAELEDPEAAEAGSEADEAGTAATGDYFATARLTRQQARDSAISLLREASDSEVADPAVADEAAQTIQTLAAYALSLFSRRIPEDISLIASEQTFFSRYGTPPQTTITPDYKAMASAVADVIEARIAGRKFPARTVLPYLLLRRESVRSRDERDQS